jgi:hypothetical protein
VLKENMGFRKKPLDKKGKAIQKGKSKTCATIKSNGGSLKKGCKCAFTIKTLYLLPIVLELSCYEKRNINATRGLYHGNIL